MENMQLTAVLNHLSNLPPLPSQQVFDEAALEHYEALNGILPAVLKGFSQSDGKHARTVLAAQLETRPEFMLEAMARFSQAMLYRFWVDTIEAEAAEDFLDAIQNLTITAAENCRFGNGTWLSNRGRAEAFSKIAAACRPGSNIEAVLTDNAFTNIEAVQGILNPDSQLEFLIFLSSTIGYMLCASEDGSYLRQRSSQVWQKELMRADADSSGAGFGLAEGLRAKRLIIAIENRFEEEEALEDFLNRAMYVMEEQPARLSHIFNDFLDILLAYTQRGDTIKNIRYAEIQKIHQRIFAYYFATTPIEALDSIAWYAQTTSRKERSGHPHIDDAFALIPPRFHTVRSQQADIGKFDRTVEVILNSLEQTGCVNQANIVKLRQVMSGAIQSDMTAAGIQSTRRNGRESIRRALRTTLRLMEGLLRVLNIFRSFPVRRTNDRLRSRQRPKDPDLR